MLCSLLVVERRLSTCRRNLPATRLSLKNDRLNNILLIKINVPVLQKVLEDAEKSVIERAIKTYYNNKNWRWNIKPYKQGEASNASCFSPPPAERSRLQDVTDIPERDEESDEKSVGSDYENN